MGPSNGINPRPVNPFIGAANPATGHERGCLLDPDSRPDIQRDGDQDTNPRVYRNRYQTRWSNDSDNGLIRDLRMSEEGENFGSSSARIGRPDCPMTIQGFLEFDRFYFSSDFDENFSGG